MKVAGFASWRRVMCRRVFAEAREGPFTPAPGGMLDLVMKTGRTVHLPDLAATQAYLERHPIMVAGSRTWWRSHGRRGADAQRQ